MVFVVLAASPSTPLVMLPCKDVTPTKTVKITPNIHIEVEFRYLDNLFICTLLETFDIMFNAIDINENGITILFIIFPTKVITNNIVGSSIDADVILPCCHQ